MSAAQAEGIPPAQTFHLGIGLQDTGWHPGSWFRIPGAQEIFTSQYWADLALAAEAGGLDFVTFEDSLGLQRHGQLDASLVASWLGARTSKIGLIPTLTTTHTEPFHVSKNLATLDHISAGRAGWQVEVSRTEAESRLFGRDRPPAELLPEDSEPWLAELYAESEQAVEVVRRLWDSWEDDAEIRDAATGRFVDREKLHYIDYQGSRFSVKGPSITPRPPQGQPVVSYQGTSEPVIKAAATSADLLFVEAPQRSLAGELLKTVRETERIFGRSGAPLQVYADLTVLVEDSDENAQFRWAGLEEANGSDWSPAGELVAGSAAAVADVVAIYQDLGFAGVRLKPAEHARDLSSIAELLVPELARREIFTPVDEPQQLRRRLGLGEAPNRHSAEQKHHDAALVGDAA
ncbi:LLM class flavin-dependent oxidoreductase [Nesterenkonia alkaliphila]|uniref:LLM class flavin-dependent oxidoreductase n=1 Tax=Nesterenkonia alkaliphila TaxID=1463631 RepID=A0A7K1ULD6_9MICC|nr:LLM class flavin-dependent oxidoreductase [Nesterenkonia alkaliphila]MVT27234.1 LLM class flavin-dependent oxidoreductase [Nesterenkonia alkaliphila]GFZ78397.1 FMNH2-utilizing oxygenase [Nesterenkonia alkaliphila]